MGVAVGVEDGVDDTDPAAGCVADARVLEPRHELGDRSLDGDAVVGLDMRRAVRGAGGSVAEAKVERVERLRQEQGNRLEAEPAPHHLAVLVRRQHLERDVRRPGLAGGIGARAQERLRDPLPPVRRDDMDRLDVPAPRLDGVRVGEPDELPGILGDEGGSATRQVLVDLRPLGVPCVRREALGLRDLGHELRPESIDALPCPTE